MFSLFFFSAETFLRYVWILYLNLNKCNLILNKIYTMFELLILSANRICLEEKYYEYPKKSKRSSLFII